MGILEAGPTDRYHGHNETPTIYRKINRTGSATNMRLHEKFPTGEQILFSRLDTSGGFCWIIVRDADCFNFYYVLPLPSGETEKVFIPSDIYIGWFKTPD